MTCRHNHRAMISARRVAEDSSPVEDGCECLMCDSLRWCEEVLEPLVLAREDVLKAEGEAAGGDMVRGTDVAMLPPWGAVMVFALTRLIQQEAQTDLMKDLMAEGVRRGRNLRDQRREEERGEGGKPEVVSMTEIDIDDAPPELIALLRRLGVPIPPTKKEVN